MTSPAVKLLGAKTAVSSAVDPLTIAAWEGAIWAEDPSQTWPSDGGSVTSWRNAGSVGGNFATDGTGTAPVWRSAVAAFNNRSTLDFTSATDRLFKDFGSIAQPVTIVIVANAAANNDQMFSGGTSSYGYLSRRLAGNVWRLFAGTAADFGPSSDANPHYWIATFDTTASIGRVDGTDYTALSVGTTDLAPLSIGGSSSDSNFANNVAFCAFVTGTLTSGEKTAFDSWASTYYGI